jgi:hypothetical protein
MHGWTVGCGTTICALCSSQRYGGQASSLSTTSTCTRDIIAGELFSTLAALPPNTTSVAQPLDVGVMDPLKAKLRAAWLEEETDFIQLTAKQKHLAIVRRTIRVWDAIEKKVVERSFDKALPVAEI